MNAGIKVVIDNIEYRARQRPGYVLIYRRSGVKIFKDTLVWDSRKDRATVGSIPARVLAEAWKVRDLDLSGERNDGR